MADSNIVLSGLQATGGANQILLSWNNPNDPNRDGLPYLQLRAVEVWASTTPRHADAVLLGESVSIAYVHSNVPRGATYYYWIRPRDVSGLYGEWSPSASSAGVVGRETNVNASLQANGFYHYPDGRVEEWGQSYSHDAIINGTSYVGVVQHDFQATFNEVFGLHAIGTLIEPDGSPTAFQVQTLIVTLYRLGPTGFTLRTALDLQSPYNSGLVHWRAFGI